MALSKESIKRLRIVKEAILAQPEYYEQNMWVSAIEPCGTTCCIAGWADFVFNGKTAHEENASRLNRFDIFGEWVKIAGEALQLTEGQADRLTDSAGDWPEPFSGTYYAAVTPEQRAKVAADRIEHFIATGGDE